MIRKCYDILSLFSMANMAALVMLMIAMMLTGSLTVEKARAMVAVLRGEPVSEKSDHTMDTTLVTVSVSSAAASVVPLDAEQEEILRRETERVRVELAQQLAAVNAVMLQVNAKREAFQREQDDRQRQETRRAEVRDSEGFKKELEYYESVSPRVAAEMLLAEPDIDNAARILMSLSTRKGKKIVESIRTPEQKEKMRIVLQRLRDVAPAQATALNDA